MFSIKLVVVLFNSLLNDNRAGDKRLTIQNIIIT